jgi:hypothetical protein
MLELLFNLALLVVYGLRGNNCSNVAVHLGAIRVEHYAFSTLQSPCRAVYLFGMYVGNSISKLQIQVVS